MDAMSRGVLKRKLILVTGRLRVKGTVSVNPWVERAALFPVWGGLVLSRQKGKGSKKGHG